MNKKVIIALLGIALISTNLWAQEKEEKEDEGYVFTNVKEIPITSVKDQNRAGTCWCYSGLGFIEAELLRMGKGEYDFSEMFIVSNTYIDRAQAAVRTHGDVSFSQGGSFYDVIYGMSHFGLVPEEEMRPGVMYGDTLSDHTELSAVSDAVVKAIAKGDHKSLQKDSANQTLWLKAIKAIHEVYLGKCPEKFNYKGREYTPMSFYQSLGLNPDDYVSITSYTHHPFNEKFVLEIQDNWRWSQCYNVT
ncbi:MAG: aminopeptidase, partial [Bacteroidales bacterium]|nr:aminopeptidase [Bacteroidales bacterium]